MTFRSIDEGRAQARPSDADDANELANIYGDAPAAVDSARAYFMKQLGQVDRALTGGRRYLMGDQFTTADILLTTCLTWAAKL